MGRSAAGGAARSSRAQPSPSSGRTSTACGTAAARARPADRLSGGVCCVCRAAPATRVDHRHETGRVRGVLCFNCNSGLGLLGEDPEAMYRAADYLEGNAWKPTLVAPGVYRLPS
ncbi:endonuclease domain-containing protein [Streptomyces sp. NPDC003480]